ncbi:hypothetical protein QTP70_005762 [Hemibagrus guttatus]|uniref:Uncharacterized protein n=1 Tax=Hemibagrus guttatus TaxID=175788 RepID=A0AAE0VCR5_9TELE|nr:hypothetical protein QTP70_005762 [Hemibagrus guttatus]
MRISTSKSEAMVLDRKKVSSCPFQVGREFLPQVVEFKRRHFHPRSRGHVFSNLIYPPLLSQSQTVVVDTTASARISACLVDISSWMTAHQLKLNPSKTELLVIPSDPSPAQDLAMSLNNSMISPSATARNLGVTMDNQLIQELNNLGELSPHWDNLRRDVITRYSHLIKTYQDTLAELEKFTVGFAWLFTVANKFCTAPRRTGNLAGARFVHMPKMLRPSFKPSCSKAQKYLEFIPINLHTQRMRVMCPRKTDAFYDVITVGAPAAHFQGFKNGGLQKLLSRYEADKKREQKCFPDRNRENSPLLGWLRSFTIFLALVQHRLL